jgi:hydrogenase-4 component H
MVDDLEANPPVRRITHRYDTCIFCGNCSDNCTTVDGINMSNKWDLATLNREDTIESHEFELQFCQKCGAKIGTKKHLVWLYEKLGPLAYTNPSLLVAKQQELTTKLPELEQQAQEAERPVDTSDFMRILCPKCKCQLTIQL